MICTSRDGDRFWKLPECYIRGNSIKYLRIPEDVIDLVQVSTPSLSFSNPPDETMAAATTTPPPPQGMVLPAALAATAAAAAAAAAAMATATPSCQAHSTATALSGGGPQAGESERGGAGRAGAGRGASQHGKRPRWGAGRSV